MGHGGRVDSILETKIHIFTHGCCITKYLTLVILHPSLHGSVIKFRVDLWTESQRGGVGQDGVWVLGVQPRGPTCSPEKPRKTQDGLKIPVSWFAAFVGGLGFSSVSML